MNPIKIIIFKEWLETLRDWRALTLMVLVPMVFYPVMVLGLGILSAKQTTRLEERPLRLAKIGDVSDTLLQNLQKWNWQPIQSTPLQSLENGEVDVVIEALPSKRHPWVQEYQLHYRDDYRGEKAKQRLQTALEKYKTELRMKHWEQHGQSPELAIPLRVQWKNHAELRESAGSKAGGVLAYFLIFLGFSGCMATACDTGAGEKERGTLEAILITSIKPWQLGLGKYAFVVSGGLFSFVASIFGWGVLAIIGMNFSDKMPRSIDIASLVQVLSLTLVSVLLSAAVLLGLSFKATTNKQANLYCSPLFLAVSAFLSIAILPDSSLDQDSIYLPWLSAALGIRGAIIGDLSWLQWLQIMLTHLGLCSLALWWMLRFLRQESTILNSN